MNNEQTLIENLVLYKTRINKFFHFYDTFHDFMKLGMVRIEKLIKDSFVTDEGNTIVEKIYDFLSVNFSKKSKMAFKKEGVNFDTLVRKIKSDKMIGTATKDKLAKIYCDLNKEPVHNNNYQKKNYDEKKIYADAGTQYGKCYVPFKDYIDNAKVCGKDTNTIKYEDRIWRKLNEKNLNYYPFYYEKIKGYDFIFYIHQTNRKNKITMEGKIVKLFLSYEPKQKIKQSISNLTKLLNGEPSNELLDELVNKLINLLNQNLDEDDKDLKTRIKNRFILALKRSGDWGQAQILYDKIDEPKIYSTIDFPAAMIAHKVFGLDVIINKNGRITHVLKSREAIIGGTNGSTSIIPINQNPFTGLVTDPVLIQKEKLESEIMTRLGQIEIINAPYNGNNWEQFFNSYLMYWNEIISIYQNNKQEMIQIIEQIFENHSDYTLINLLANNLNIYDLDFYDKISVSIIGISNINELIINQLKINILNIFTNLNNKTIQNVLESIINIKNIMEQNKIIPLVGNLDETEDDEENEEETNEYYLKYLKYKTKYIELKNKIQYFGDK